MRLNDDNKTVAAMDVLVPSIGEIIGGSQREDRLDLLVKRMDELGLPKKDYWWYLELRKYGSVPHAGFGLGLERLVLLQPVLRIFVRLSRSLAIQSMLSFSNNIFTA